MELDMELIPSENYNVVQAHVRCCISWILTKAFGSNLPVEYNPPFVLSSKGQQLLKLSVISGLVSSDIYCKACSNIFSDASKFKGHMDVLQALSRHSVHVSDPHVSVVTENLLEQNAPFKLSCHLALIEALMMSHTQELVTAEKVVQAVRKFSSFSASSELPYDAEDAILLWINKVCSYVRQRFSKTSRKIFIPVMDDLLKDTSDGCCMATVINFYSPDAFPFNDIALGDPIDIADCLYNLQLIKYFCQLHIPGQCDYISVNDIFHAEADLKNVIMVFFAELFHSLEVEKIDIARHVESSSEQDRQNNTKTASISVSISNATKRSFQQLPSEGLSSNSPLDKKRPSPCQPLLPRRPRQGENFPSAEYVKEKGIPIKAWEARSCNDTRPGPTNVSAISSEGTALTNVSSHEDEVFIGAQQSNMIHDNCDSNINRSNLTSSNPLDDFQGCRIPRAEILTDYIEVENIISVSSSRELSNEKTQRKRTSDSNVHSSNFPKQAPESLNLNLKKDSNKAFTTFTNDGSDSETPDEDYKTPSLESIPFPGQNESVFFGENVLPGIVKNINDNEEPSITSSTKKTPVSESFVLSDQNYTLESARAAGLPIVENTTTLAHPNVNNILMQSKPIQRPESLRVTKETPDSRRSEGSPPKKGNDMKNQITTVPLPNTNQNEACQKSKNKSKQKVHKKTTFAALPNQTTWHENAHDVSLSYDSEENSSQDSSPSSSELVDIKMRLEKRRRQIETEKRRIEFQWTKQRQKLGKQAFIHVINRGKSETDLQQIQEDNKNTGLAKSFLKKKKVRPSSTRSKECSKGNASSMKVSSAPVSREQSTDRQGSLCAPNKQTKLATDKVSAIQQHLISPEVKDLSNHSTLSFSEGEETSTHVKDSLNKVRPKSYHAPETMTQSMPSSLQKLQKSVENDRGTQSLTSSTDNQKLGYTSLDRLNCSLSELQGEIMRLSLQQDQIKSLVASDQGSTKTTDVSPVSSKTSSSDKYYLYPRNGVGERDLARSKANLDEPQSLKSSPKQTQNTPMSLCNVATEQSMPTSQSTLSSATYPTQPSPSQQSYTQMQPYPPHPYTQYHPVYSMHQYQGVPPHYQTGLPLYQQSPHVYHTSSQDVMPSEHRSGNGDQSQKLSKQLQHQLDHSVNSDSSPPPPDEVSCVLGETKRSPKMSDVNTSLAAADHTLHVASSQQTETIHSPHNPAGEFPCIIPSAGPASSPIDMSVILSDVHQHAPSEGFFVTLDKSDRKTRPKPKLPRHKRTTSGDGEKDFTSDAILPSQTLNPPFSPVGFVIGDEESIIEHATQREMEKKKQKILQQQLRRQEENMKKKHKKETDYDKQKEEQRLKQEKLEQRKAEEKSRREAIFQCYLRRKAEEMDEEPKQPATGSSNPQINKSTRSRPRTTRPKSQPPLGIHDDILSQSSHSQSSQEDIHMRATSPQPPDSGHVVSVPCNRGDCMPQSEMDYQQLAYGGLTHRCAPSPDQLKQLMDTEADIPLSHVQPGQDYSGPKLFKKPSQKSNRTIMINAVSHCCLAGSVNTSVKNKVLEVVARSEAKHFIILFRDAGMQYKGLYTYDLDKEEVMRIHGVGPKQLTDVMMEKFYKYNSGGKNFSEVTSTKHLSATIDAVVISNSLWQKKAITNRRLPNQF